VRRHVAASNFQHRRRALNNTAVEVDFQVNDNNNSSFDLLFASLSESIYAAIRENLALHSWVFF